MSTRPALLLTIATLLGCPGGGGSKPAPVEPHTTGPTADAAPERPAEPPAKTRTLDADTTITTPSGATFTASKGWTIEERADRLSLTPPEADVTVVLVELEAADRDAAITAAWAKWKPGFDLAAAQTLDIAGRGAWDEGGQTVYVTPGEEQRLVLALARRKGTTWYVILVDGAIAGVDRRGAQLGTIVESFLAPGMEKETFAGRTAHPLDQARLDLFEDFIEEALVTTRVPGAAVAVVQGGKIVYAKGFGVRELGGKKKVTPKTLFLIGSVTKSLTTLMLARQVEAGTFGWDTPVTDVLPSFALGDEATTAQVQMRHTACACTGMPRQDLEMIFETDLAPEESVALLGAMKPTTGFGETFQYSNLMVSAGGYAGAHAYAPKKKLGPAYDKAMQDLVFKPLGMKSTTFDFKKAKKADHATPHPIDLQENPLPAPLSDEKFVVPVRPAGGAWSNVLDMARVALLELGKGKLDGKQVVGEDAILARRQPQVKITDHLSYGLGLVVGTESGIPVVTHSGGTIGMVTEFAIWPEHDVGLVILTNSAIGGLFTGAVERRLLEILFDGNEEAKDNLAKVVEQRAAITAAEWERVEPKPDPTWFAPLAGTWKAAGLGTIVLRADKKGNATLDAGEWKVSVGRKTDRDGTVKLISTGPPIAGIELVPAEKDGTPVLVLVDSQRSYFFEKVK